MDTMCICFSIKINKRNNVYNSYFLWFFRNVGPVEREQQNFPRSYVQSTHRQDFFERFNADEDANNSEGIEHDSRKSGREKSSTSWVGESEVFRILLSILSSYFGY